MKRLAKEHIYLTHGHRSQCSDVQREGVGAEWKGARRREIRLSLMVPIIKLKKIK